MPSCCSEKQNSAVAVLGIIFVGEIEKKTENMLFKTQVY